MQRVPGDAIPGAVDRALDQSLLDRLDNDFTYHAPTAEQIGIFRSIRDDARRMAGYVARLGDMSREKSVALTKLDEFVMWANAHVARNRVGVFDAERDE